MTYTFTSLSPADFEDLSRELVGAEIGVRFEGFSIGADGGSDGRYASAGKNTTLQAKHYAGSQFSALKATMKRERSVIDQIKPDRYLLTTSRPLTPANKNTLASIIGGALRSEDDILGPADLNTLLRKFPNIERSHIKLWLSSSAVLERVIRSSVYAYTATSRADIEAKVRVYAQNPSFKEARDRLERDHVLIISGPPGVGKTTLAEMLAYAYIGEEWEFVAIRSLDDGFGEIVDAKKQIFFFDDFLGKVALDQKSLASKDSELIKLIKRIRKTSNARFILTTRAYIFEEAKRASESISDRQLEIATYVLDVGAYTRRIRARILYNHLYVAQLHKNKIKELLKEGVLPKIIDHINYNPRIIEWMTDELNVQDIEPGEYVKQFMKALDHPTKIWDTAFRAHIPPKCRHLLIVLFFCSEYGAEIEDLEQAFNAVNPVLSTKYNLSYSTKDFGESIKIAEGSFLKIQGNGISFINPSVRDYLADYLKDKKLLEDLAATSLVADWAQAVWMQFCSVPDLSAGEIAAFVRLFSPRLGSLVESAVWQRQRHDKAGFRYHDMFLAKRAELFFDWWKITKDTAFIQAMFDLIQNPRRDFGSSFNAIEIIKLISLVDEQAGAKLFRQDELSSELEKVLIKAIDREDAPDKLEKIWERIDDERSILSHAVIDAANRAIEYQLDEMTSLVSDVDSGSTLSDHVEAVRALGERVNAASERVDAAVKAITDRIAEIEERTSDADEPEFTGEGRQRHDVFDDDEITNLFSLLL